jgi:hypothetical protein
MTNNELDVLLNFLSPRSPPEKVYATTEKIRGTSINFTSLNGRPTQEVIFSIEPDQ